MRHAVNTLELNHSDERKLLEAPECSLVDALMRASRSPGWLDLGIKEHAELAKDLRERQWHGVAALMDRADHASALVPLEELTDLTPRDARFPRLLFECQLKLGLLDQAEETLTLFERDEDAFGANARLTAARARSHSSIAESGISLAAKARARRRRARRLYHVTLGWGKPERHDPRDWSGDTLTIVTGLPRSGTSLMMQMLHRGGMDVCTSDDKPDADNPGGYFECNRMKRCVHHPVLLEELQGRALKLFCDMVQYLPVSHRYKIVMMIRPPEEIVVSQKKLVERRPHLQRIFASPSMSVTSQLTARDRMLRKLKQWPQVELLTVDFPQLVAEPQVVAARLVQLLGRDRLPHGDRMASLIDKRLYRNRSTTDVDSNGDAPNK